MQLSLFRRTIFSLAIIFVTTGYCSAQERLQDQFDDFYQNQTSTWQEYKLVKMPRLKEFWKVVADTIKVKESKNASAQEEINSLNDKLEDVKNNLQDTQAALSESEALNDSIAFIGIQMGKSTYNMLVWLIIAGLIVGIVSLYFVYLGNNRVTREARKNLVKIEEEYTIHQEKARESQTKLKRELQTALNTLQEHRIKI